MHILPSNQTSIVVHGDDLTALAGDEVLDWYESELMKSFEINIRGRLGIGCKAPQEIRILNRIVSVDEHGLNHDADPSRHTDLLMASMNLTSSNYSTTPGVKPVDRDELAIEEDNIDTSQLSPDAAIAAICQNHGPVRRPRRGRHKQSAGTLGTLPFDGPMGRAKVYTEHYVTK